jgi:hypothetical protein
MKPAPPVTSERTPGGYSPGGETPPEVSVIVVVWVEVDVVVVGFVVVVVAVVVLVVGVVLVVLEVLVVGKVGTGIVVLVLLEVVLSSPEAISASATPNPTTSATSRTMTAFIPELMPPDGGCWPPMS